MNWVDLLLLLAFVVGLAAGGVLVSRSPAFWLGMLELLIRRLWPYLMKLWVRLKLPLDPKAQEKLEHSRRRAEEWDHFRKKPRDR
jgi:hypothetical protein